MAKLIPTIPSTSGEGGRPNLFMSLVALLSDEIRSGAMPPGSQVPTRKALAQTHATTVVTVQKALAFMERVGMVESQGWRGTFVTATPPCLCRYAILLPTRLDGGGEIPVSDYHRSVAAMARTVGTPQQTFQVFEGLAEPAGGDRQALATALEEHAIAGLVCVDADPFAHLDLAEAIRAQRLVVVRLGSRIPKVCPWELAFDFPDFLHASLGALAEAGCRRPAVALHAIAGNWLDEVRRIAVSLGLELPDGFALGFDPHHTCWVRPWLRLLLAMPAGQRPDGLLVGDDHLLRAAWEALGEFRPGPATGLPVVAHANLPSQQRIDGVVRIGFDLGQALAMAAGMIRDARASGARSGRLLLPAARST